MSDIFDDQLESEERGMDCYIHEHRREKKALCDLEVS